MVSPDGSMRQEERQASANRRFQALNIHATRETHHTRSQFHQARSVPSNKKKTVFDCWNEYHSVALEENDRHLTTFITPCGRYRNKTAPQDIPDKTKCIDDTLLWADNLTTNFFQAVNWLDICGRNGITLNPDKFTFGEDTVEFAGFQITMDTVRPRHRYIDVIRHFPTPTNNTDVRSWFGMINEVSYTFAATERLLQFRQLLKPGTPFKWNSALDQIFEESKSVIINEINEGIRIFDK
ncbi:Hypothetical predicted protein [Paramuricea clavata]|uniref:Uncharacterized protein n=1 Tax=Paramuricea clavata TaxID=317549 RepID=A0A6S7I4U9_PARCT|nr:Hypothetical predicted protein [Paramuricea clavata]